MWSAGNHFGGGALHFFEFGHEVRLGVQSACSIHDDDFGRARFGSGYRIVNNGGWVGAGFLLDDFNSVALRPDFELLDGGGAKSVRGTKHYATILPAKPVCQLANASGLACAIYADNEDDARPGAIRRGGDPTRGHRR